MGFVGMLPRKKMIKNGVIWCILSVPKYVIINLKRILNQQQKLFDIFSNINPDVHASTKMNTFNFTRTKSILKNQTKWRLFL